MDVREKLVELLRNSPHLDTIKGYKGSDCTFEQGADWLIRNGVTVHEWISVKERPPEKEGWYQVYTTPDKGHRSINKAQYRKQPSWSVNAGEGYWCGSGGIWTNVTHWMPLPEPPKEE